MQWKQQAPACGWYISYLYRKSLSQMATAFKSIGFSGNQSVVLVGVYRNEGINQRTLADTIAMAPGVMSRVLRDLEDAGYVEKRRDEENRRNYLLYLTPAGTAAAEQSSRTLPVMTVSTLSSSLGVSWSRRARAWPDRGSWYFSAMARAWAQVERSG